MGITSSQVSPKPTESSKYHQSNEQNDKAPHTPTYYPDSDSDEHEPVLEPDSDSDEHDYLFKFKQTLDPFSWESVIFKDKPPGNQPYYWIYSCLHLNQNGDRINTCGQQDGWRFTNADRASIIESNYQLWKQQGSSERSFNLRISNKVIGIRFDLMLQHNTDGYIRMIHRIDGTEYQNFIKNHYQLINVLIHQGQPLWMCQFANKVIIYPMNVQDQLNNQAGRSVPKQDHGDIVDICLNNKYTYEIDREIMLQTNKRTNKKRPVIKSLVSEVIDRPIFDIVGNQYFNI